MTDSPALRPPPEKQELVTVAICTSILFGGSVFSAQNMCTVYIHTIYKNSIIHEHLFVVTKHPQKKKQVSISSSPGDCRECYGPKNFIKSLCEALSSCIHGRVLCTVGGM